MSAYILTQIILTPLYLRILGEEQFGLIMILLGIINFTIFGVSWFSGGIVRVLGEYWSKENFENFKKTLILGKYVFTLYASLISILILIIFFVFKYFEALNNIDSSTILLLILYFLITYESISERQAFLGANWQALGNNIEFIKVFVFALLTIYFLPQYKNINIIFIALIAGAITQRLITGSYLRLKLDFRGWEKFNNSMKTDFNRFFSKEGLNYFYFGTLVLLLQLDVVIIGLIGGPVIAGKFVILWKIPEVLGLILAKIPSSLEPKIIHLDTKSEMSIYNKLFLKSKNLFILLCFITSVFYMLSGEYLVKIWVGNNAPNEDWMYYIAGVALFFYSISRWPISFAFAQIKLKQLIKISLIELIFKFIFTLILFEHFSYLSPLIGMILIHTFYVAKSYQSIQ